MYNQIPSERTSKRTIFMALLICATLMSLCAVGYFAWLARTATQQPTSQTDATQQIASNEQRSAEETPVQEPVQQPSETTFVQVPFAEPDSVQSTALSTTLRNWQHANASANYCSRLLTTFGTIEWQRMPLQELFTDDDARDALRWHFQVDPSQDEYFFAGITSAIDANNTLYVHNMVCTAGDRKFLLLNDVRVPTVDDHVAFPSNDPSTPLAFPKIFEWNVRLSTWIRYPSSHYQVIDGYTLIPDWNGNAVVMTGYGDAGWAHWQYEMLEPETPALRLLEACIITPSADPMEAQAGISVLQCEVEYSEN